MSLEQIREKALELKSLRDKKAELNDELQSINESIKEIEEYTLSPMMDNESITDITIDGVKIKKGVVFRGGITSSSDKSKFQFLFDSNNEGALKQKLIVNLEGKTDEEIEDAKDLIAGLGFNSEISYTIHHMTLSSLLKELVAEGRLSTEDFTTYKIYAQPQIKVEQK